MDYLLHADPCRRLLRGLYSRTLMLSLEKLLMT